MVNNFFSEKIKKIEEELGQFDLEKIQMAEKTDEALAAILIVEHRIGFLQSELLWLKKVKKVLQERSVL